MSVIEQFREMGIDIATEKIQGKEYYFMPSSAHTTLNHLLVLPLYLIDSETNKAVEAVEIPLSEIIEENSKEKVLNKYTKLLVERFKRRNNI